MRENYLKNILTIFRTNNQIRCNIKFKLIIYFFIINVFNTFEVTENIAYIICIMHCRYFKSTHLLFFRWAPGLRAMWQNFTTKYQKRNINKSHKSAAHYRYISKTATYAIVQISKPALVHLVRIFKFPIVVCNKLNLILIQLYLCCV